jgi:PAS domain S-box-containing protein
MGARKDCEPLRTPIELQSEVEARTADLRAANERLHQEITARQENELRLRLALEASGAATWIIDYTRAGTEHFDARSCELAGLDATQADWPAGTFCNLLHPEDRERMQLVFSQTRGMVGPGPLAEYRILTTRHDVRWLQGAGIIQRNAQGEPQRFIGVSTDVTYRKQAEAALAVRTDELHAASRHKDEFLAMMAHELRNPLASILNAAEALNTENPSRCDVSWAFGNIAHQATHMARMLDDLLDVSRITRKQLSLRPQYLNIVKVIQSAAEAMQPTIEARGAELALTLPGAPLHVYADSTRLEQAVANLISNAAKYTESSGRIQVTCRREDLEVLVSVKDNGIGIDPGELPKLFQLFSRGQLSDGLGIGLWLVREIITMHGGSVEAISEGVGKGSEFRVRLPVPQPHLVGADSARDFPPREDIAPKRRVLVVDDQVEVANSLARLLKVMGHTVYVAYDGVSAIGTGAMFKPDAILLDVGMSNMDGYETCRQIRQQPWGREILITAVTGWSRESDIRHAMEAGFDQHLAKPVDRSTLTTLLASVALHTRLH